MTYFDPFVAESNVDRIAAGLPPVEGDSGTAVPKDLALDLREIVKLIYEPKYDGM